tara:strand:+ start:3049 stop:4377 length:1329 start_codon:yes stop_codon:yes gene_type:complete
MNFFYKIISILDIRLSFVRIEPLSYPAKMSFLNLMKNFSFNILNLNFREILKDSIFLIFFLIINSLKVMYLPLAIVVYFSRYRFIQINYSQFGTINLDLHIMVKKNLNKGYKSIILIPNYSNFYFLKKIFKNLKIINNNFLNIFLLPLKHTSFISVKAEEANILFDENLNYVTKQPYSIILNRYKKKYKNKEKKIFEFKEEFNKEMKIYFKNNFSSFDLNKTIILHHREAFFNKTSHWRGSDLSNYLPTLKYLLKKGYGVIRLTHTKSKKLIFKSKKYAEINTDEHINKLFQYYIISKCRGFICTDSGPCSVGTYLNTPIYDTNIFGMNIAGINKKSTYILKKVKLNKRVLLFKELIELGYYKGFLYSRKMNKSQFSIVQNTPDELLEGLKEFININKKKKKSSLQKNFKKSIPNYMELKNYDAFISQYFIKKNIKLFKGLI